MDNLENKAVELSREELENVTGGNDGFTTRRVCNLKSGFLAIRSMPAYDAANELGALFNGDYVYSREIYSKDGKYVWVYAETQTSTYYGKAAYSGYGWVNRDFLS